MAILPIRPLLNDLALGLDVRRNARSWFNQQGMKSEGLAKSRVPVRTGFLRSTINWSMIGSDISAAGGVLQGRLRIGAVYGRRQEWEHRSRAFYAWSSVKEVADEISATLGSEEGAASVWLGVGRGYQGTWSWNPTFSEGGTPKRFNIFHRDNARNRAFTYTMNRNRAFTTVGSARIRTTRR